MLRDDHYFALKLLILWVDFVLALAFIFFGFLVCNGIGAFADFFGGVGPLFFLITFAARFAGLPEVPNSTPPYWIIKIVS